VNVKHTGIYVGIGYTTVVLLWIIGQMSMDTDPAITVIVAIKALLITQFLIITVTTPWFAQGQDRSSNAINILLIVIIPLPLFLALSRSADIENAGIWFSQLMAICLATACYTLTRILLQQLTNHQTRHMGISVLQVLTATYVWADRDRWLAWYLA
jgi:hypothetical protein